MEVHLLALLLGQAVGPHPPQLVRGLISTRKTRDSIVISREISR